MDQFTRRNEVTFKSVPNSRIPIQILNLKFSSMKNGNAIIGFIISSDNNTNLNEFFSRLTTIVQR